MKCKRIKVSALTLALISATGFSSLTHADSVAQASINIAVENGFTAIPLNTQKLANFTYAGSLSPKVAVAASGVSHKVFISQQANGQWALVHQSTNGDSIIANFADKSLANAAKTSLALDSNGSPVVLFTAPNSSTSNAPVKLASLQGSAWQITELTHAQGAKQIDLALDSQDQVHMVYDMGNGQGYYSFYSLVSDSWKVHPIYEDADTFSLTLVNDSPVIGFYQRIQQVSGIAFANGDLNSSGFLQREMIPNSGHYPQIQLDTAGNIGVASLVAGKDLVYSQSLNGQWQNSLIATNVMPFYSVAADTNSVLFAYQQQNARSDKTTYDMKLATFQTSAVLSQFLWHSGGLTQPSLAINPSNQQPLIGFDAIPSFNSDEHAGWTQNVLAALPYWAADKGYLNKDPAGYAMQWRGAAILQASPVNTLPFSDQGTAQGAEQSTKQSTKQNYVLATSEQGEAFYLAFDEQGRFQTRMPLNLDSPTRMRANIESQVDYQGAAGVQADVNADGVNDIVIAGKDAQTQKITAEIHYKLSPSLNSFASQLTGTGVRVVLNEMSSASLTDIASADFNQDGFADIVLAQSGSKQSYIYLGNAQGQLTFWRSLNSSFAVSGLNVQDVNQDGTPDIMVAGNTQGQQLQLFVSDNNANYQRQDVTFNAGNNLASGKMNLTLADFNNDGIADIVASNTASGGASATLTFHAGQLQNGVLSFSQQAVISDVGNGSQASRLTYTDINQDGALDILLADETSAEIQLYLGDAAGQFSLMPQAFAYYTEALDCNNCGLQLLDPEKIAQQDNIQLHDVALSSISAQ